MRIYPTIYLDAVTITVIVILSIAVIAVGLILLNVFVLRHKKDEKLVSELRKKYEYIHSLLIGQDSSYVKRLELLGDVNLLVLPIYEKYNKRYENLRDYNDKLALNALVKLETVVKEKNHKAFMEEYNKQYPIIIAYEKEVLELHRDLKAVIKPEDDARAASLEVKEQLRHVKAIYRSHSTELAPLDQSFNKMFDKLEQYFRDYERHVELAGYDEANEIIEMLGQVVSTLKQVLTTLPDLCLRTYSVLPQKIIELNEAYESMVKQNYPLFHLLVSAHIESMNKTLVQIDAKLQKFDLKDVDELLSAMDEKIDELHKQFAKERKEKFEYDNKNEHIYADVTSLEREFVKLANLMPKIKQVYDIPQAKLQIVSDLKIKINDLNNAKRQLDTFVHSATQQPYSVLVEKIEQLSNESSKVKAELNDYQAYIKSLKTNVEKANTLVRDVYYELKNFEHKLRELNVAPYSAKHKNTFEKCYTHIENIRTALSIQPMNVEAINKDASLLSETAKTLFEILTSDLNLAALTENIIVSANAFRHQFSEAQAKLNQYEILFYQGKFEEAYKAAGNLLKEYYKNS